PKHTTVLSSQQLSIIFAALILLPPTSTLFPYTTLFRSTTMPLLSATHNLRKSPSARNARSGFCGNRFGRSPRASRRWRPAAGNRSEEHTSELQSRFDIVCRLLREKKNDINVESI